MPDEPVPTAIVRGVVPQFHAASSELPAGVVVIPTYALYTRGQIGFATFLGGPIGGTWLLARNFSRLRRPAAARMSLVLGVLATVLLVIVGLSGVLGTTTASFGSFPAILTIVAMVGIASATQGNELRQHVELGGGLVSSWYAFASGLIGLVITFAIAIAGVVAIDFAQRTPSVEFGEGRDVYYHDGVSETDARATGDALTRLEYFSPGHPAAVDLHVEAGRYVVSFVVNDHVFDDRDQQAAFHAIGVQLSTEVWSSAQLDVWLVDPELQPHVKLVWEQRPGKVDLGAGHEITYRFGASEAEARAIAPILTESYFGDGQPSTVRIEYEAGHPVVGFFLQTGAWDEPETRSAIHRLADPLSKAAFKNAPLDLQLLDPRGHIQGRLGWAARPGY
jgi:hypothetical protein